jgi:tryptophanyl-tRNA synthetase
MKYLFGIQPTGKIHIGNYLGGIEMALKLQKNNDVEFLIADQHALTTKTEKDVECLMLKTEEKLHAMGAKKVLFQKFEIHQKCWEIMCVTPVSELNKMTQWKIKGGGNAGLLIYPCLMAADIILSNPDVVIIGEDQVQHFEFYRDVCRRLKIEPCRIIMTKTPRIMSIKDPTKKMSKSLGDEHCLYLGEDNYSKIMKAPTDELGIKNLKLISAGLKINFSEKRCEESKKKIIAALAII